MMAMMLVANASGLVLRPQHWLIRLGAFMEDAQAFLPLDASSHQALPVHVSAVDAVAGQLGSSMSPTDRDAAVTGIIEG